MMSLDTMTSNIHQPHRRRGDIYLAAALFDATRGDADMVELVDEWERAERVGC